MKTLVKCQCISKKEMPSYNSKNPIQTEIELQVPYDQESIFYQMSGGTAIRLMTVNQEAADMFKLGKSYDVNISPSED